MNSSNATATRPGRVRLIGSLVACVAVYTTAGCGPSGQQTTPTPTVTPEPFGTRLAFGHHELYFTPGIKPADAQKVGEILVREKWFGEHPATVQIRYLNRRYELRCVIRAGVESNATTRPYRHLGETIASDVFRSSPVDIHQCDEQLNTLRVIPYEPLRPDLPVRVTLRPAANGKSLVAQYRNDSAKYLTVQVVLWNPTLGESKSGSLNIGPKGVTEHGWLEGWAYRSGETITISHADYETAELVVP
ncbi:MAG: hypothetical protein K8U57_15020 [Planctomycetes bacterium]|nr:hypothetical protein [Planctomycetota bacterium]